MPVLLAATMSATAGEAYAFSENPAECDGVVSWSAPVAVVPASPRSGDPITVCMLHMTIAASVNVSRTGNHITVTVVDSGMDWGPNPEIVVAETLAPLPVGTYLLDASVQRSANIFLPLATGFVFDVAGVAPIPVLGIPSYLALAGLVSLMGLAFARRRGIPNR